MKVKDLVSVIDFSKNKWLNVGYFDEQNKFVTIMEHCEDEIYIEDEDIKEYVVMNSTVDKLWSVFIEKDMEDLFVTIKESEVR